MLLENTIPFLLLSFFVYGLTMHKTGLSMQRAASILTRAGGRKDVLPKGRLVVLS
jgi:hypothetical protein